MSGKVVDGEVVTEDAEILGSGALQIITNKSLTPVERMRQTIDAMKMLPELHRAVRTVSLSVTQARDWRDWNGKLRPEVAAASAIMRTLGIRMDNQSSEKRITNNGYQYLYTADFTWEAGNCAVIGVMGSARSDDDIVSTRYEWDDETKKRVKKEVPASDVDEAIVQKKAQANMIVNGVMRLVGLGNVTTEELQTAGVIKSAGDVARVDHSKKGWEISDSQKGLAERLFATEQEIDVCKSNADVTNLINKLKAEKRKAKPAADAATPPAPGGPGTATEPPEADPAIAIVDNLNEMGEKLEFKAEVIKSKIEEARAKGLPGLKSLQQSWAELCRAKR